MDMQAISAEFRKVKTVRYAQLGMSIAALVLILIPITRPAGLGIGVITVFLYLFWGRKTVRQYCDQVLQLNLCHGLGDGMENPRATGSGSLSEETFDSWQMIPRREGKGEVLLSRNGFAFTHRGTEFHGTELTVHYGVGPEGSRKTYHFVSGTAIWRQGGAGDWLLLHKDWIHPAALEEFIQANGYHPAQLDEALDKDFLLFSHQADTVLPEETEQRIIALSQDAKTLAAVRLSEQASAVLLVNRFYAAKVSANAEPTQRELTLNTLPERDAVLKVLRNG